MTPFGASKKYIHLSAIAIIILSNTILLGLGAIDASPSNGICYLSMYRNYALLMTLDIVPNILFIFVSTLCVISAVKTLRQELKIIQRADLVSDDLVNLIYRMIAFLILGTLSSCTIILVELAWIHNGSHWSELTEEYIQCTQTQNEWDYTIGDECIEELQEKDGYSFPNEIVFIVFPTAVLLRFVLLQFQFR